MGCFVGQPFNVCKHCYPASIDIQMKNNMCFVDLFKNLYLYPPRCHEGRGKAPPVLRGREVDGGSQRWSTRSIDIWTQWSRLSLLSLRGELYFKTHMHCLIRVAGENQTHRRMRIRGTDLCYTPPPTTSSTARLVGPSSCHTTSNGTRSPRRRVHRFTSLHPYRASSTLHCIF